MIQRPRISFFAAVTAAASVLALAAPAVHADTSNEAFIGGTLVHTVRTTWAGLTPDQRAAIVQQRLNGILSRGPISPADFSVGQVQGDWCVLFEGKRFITADAATAKQDQSSPKALAEVWLTQVQKTLPPLTAPTGK